MLIFQRLAKMASMVACLPWLATGCISNPATHGQVAASRAEAWQAPAAVAIPDNPVLPGEEDIDDAWTKHKGPWQLVDLVDIALQNNPATMQTWENAKAAAYSWKASKSTLYPTVTFTEELLLQKVSGALGGATSASVAADNSTAVSGGGVSNAMKALSAGATTGTTTGISSAFNYNQWFIGTLSFSYLMLDWGGRLSAIESARQALFAADWTHNRNLQTVILNVMLDYYQHLQAKALFLAREDDLKNATENFKAADAQFQAGVSKKLDVLLAQSNMSNAELLLEQQRGLVQTTMGRLANSLGLPANIVFAIADLPEEKNLNKIQDDIDGLIAIAKVDRPDLAAAEATWKQQKENAKVIWSQGMPSMTANGFVEKNSNIHHPVSNSRIYNASILLNVPLFNGFYYVNQTRAANATAASSYAAWKAVEENVMLDVVTSYYNFKTAIETVKASEEYYKYTNESYDVAFASYTNGVGTILDLLAAQDALSNARSQRIQARTQWLTALANVAYATGSL